MAQGWLKPLALGCAAVGVALAGIGIVKRGAMAERLAESALAGAATDDDRVRHARVLLDLADPGPGRFTALFESDRPDDGRAAATAFADKFAEADPADPAFVAWCQCLVRGAVAPSDAGAAAMLDLVPTLLRATDPGLPTLCRPLVAAGLRGTPEAKLLAVRHALHPKLNARADLVPLLADADATVRRAALLAVGPATDDGSEVVGTEDLFHALHDADAEVRDLAAAALRSRGLNLSQVSLARQLSHPDPAERMALLTDLGTEEAVKDAGPWLERLSRDADPAVRLGTARVAFEMRLQFTGWLDRLCRTDPDATVRRWATYYQQQAALVRQAGH